MSQKLVVLMSFILVMMSIVACHHEKKGSSPAPTPTPTQTTPSKKEEQKPTSEPTPASVAKPVMELKGMLVDFENLKLDHQLCSSEQPYSRDMSIGTPGEYERVEAGTKKVKVKGKEEIKKIYKWVPVVKEGPIDERCQELFPCKDDDYLILRQFLKDPKGIAPKLTRANLVNIYKSIVEVDDYLRFVHPELNRCFLMIKMKDKTINPLEVSGKRIQAVKSLMRDLI